MFCIMPCIPVSRSLLCPALLQLHFMRRLLFSQCVGLFNFALICPCFRGGSHVLVSPFLYSCASLLLRINFHRLPRLDTPLTIRIWATKIPFFSIGILQLSQASRMSREISWMLNFRSTSTTRYKDAIGDLIYDSVAPHSLYPSWKRARPGSCGKKLLVTMRV